MNLVRAYKLKLLGIAIDPLHYEIIEFLNDKFNDLTKASYNTGLNLYYFNFKNEYVFEKTYKNDLLVRYENIWEVLEKKYLMSFENIQKILKFIIETKYKYVISNERVFYMFSIDFQWKEYDYTTIT